MDGFLLDRLQNAGNSVIAFARKANDQNRSMLCVCNFTPVLRQAYRLGVSSLGWHREVLNSDAACYGGSSLGNYGGVSAEPVASHGFSNSISLTLPPLSVLFLRRE